MGFTIVLMGPVLFPLAQQIGMHDIHFCILMVTSLGIGFVTPPIGLNLFVISGVTGEAIMESKTCFSICLFDDLRALLWPTYPSYRWYSFNNESGSSQIINANALTCFLDDFMKVVFVLLYHSFLPQRHGALWLRVCSDT